MTKMEKKGKGRGSLGGWPAFPSLSETWWCHWRPQWEWVENIGAELLYTKQWWRRWWWWEWTTLRKFAYPPSRLHRVTGNWDQFAVSCKYHIGLDRSLFLEAHRSVLSNVDAMRVTALLYQFVSSRVPQEATAVCRLQARRAPGRGTGCDVKLDLALRVAINCSRSQEPRSTHIAAASSTCRIISRLAISSCSASLPPLLAVCSSTSVASFTVPSR